MAWCYIPGKFKPQTLPHDSQVPALFCYVVVVSAAVETRDSRFTCQLSHSLLHLVRRVVVSSAWSALDLNVPMVNITQECVSRGRYLQEKENISLHDHCVCLCVCLC
jgi:hypothetical protein